MTLLALRADVTHFFPLCFGQAPFVPGNVCRLHCRLLGPQHGCPKPFLRCSRCCDNECRDHAGGVATTSQSLCPLVPSSAKGGLNGGRSPGSRRRGGGGRPRPWDTTLAASLGAGVDGQSQATGAEPKGLCAPRRAMTPRHPPCRARHIGAARRGPVRRWAPPLRSLRRGATCP